jgi:sec-independent protein translocase protein TatA
MLEQIIPTSALPLGQFSFGSLGTPEIVVIMVVALIVFGPRKLPEIGRQIGNAMREFKKFSADVQDTFNLREHLDIDRHLNNNSHSSYDQNYHQYDNHQYDAYGAEINAAPTDAYPALDQYGLEASNTPSMIESAPETTNAEVPVKPKRTRKPKVVEAVTEPLTEVVTEAVMMDGSIIEGAESAPKPAKVRAPRAPRAKKVAEISEPKTESETESETTIEI